MNTNYTKTLAGIAVIAGASIFCGGCSRSHTEVMPEQPRAEMKVIKAPGVVEYVWEEPMVDVIDVPPGLDPEGHYYRPAHQSIVEIRQGHWKHYRDPNGENTEPAAEE